MKNFHQAADADRVPCAVGSNRSPPRHCNAPRRPWRGRWRVRNWGLL